MICNLFAIAFLMIPTIDYRHCSSLTLLQIVNWRTHLKFPEEAKLSPEAKDLICKLLCNVEQRLGTRGADEIKVLCGVFCSNSFMSFLNSIQLNELTVWKRHSQAHPWFKGVEWDKLYQMKAAFIPEVNDELDTQNFEKFEEVAVKSSIHIIKLINGLECSLIDVSLSILLVD